MLVCSAIHIVAHTRAHALLLLQVRWHLIRQYHAKLKSNYVWTEGDVEWSERNTVLYPLICSLAGLVAGMFGVGGCALPPVTAFLPQCTLDLQAFLEMCIARRCCCLQP